MKNKDYTYDYEINFQTTNPAAIILKDIEKESYVLELGPSTGYMTKYLKEVLKCKVTCIEIDEAAAEIAKQYCEKMIVGNLDRLNLKEILEQKYDYILMADVLEHLLEPKQILTKLKSFLKPSGVMWISIPNISHISIIQQLIENQFQYGKWGLLDNTHVRFFTKNTIKDLFQELDYKIEESHDIIKYPNETEFDSQHLESNFIKSMILEKNQDLYTYQMVFKLKVDNEGMVEFKSDTNVSFFNESKYYSKLYIDFGDGFNEKNTSITTCNCVDNKFYIEFKSFDHMSKVSASNVRLDLLEGRYSYIKILGASYKDCKNVTKNISLEKLTHNADIVKSDKGMYFFNYDPQIYFNINGIYLREIRVWGECKTEKDLEVSKYLNELLETSKEKCDRYLTDLKGKDIKIHELEEKLKFLQSRIDELESILNLKDKTIKDFNKQINEQANSIKFKDCTIIEVNKQMDELKVQVEQLRENSKTSLIKRLRK